MYKMYMLLKTLKAFVTGTYLISKDLKLTPLEDKPLIFKLKFVVSVNE